MNLFETIGKVLDEQFESIHASEAERIVRVKAALAALPPQYQSLAVKNEISYKDSATRFGYVFRYTTCHAGLAFQVISGLKSLKKLFNSKSLTVSCIGGGPGSDLLGILKYAEVVLNNEEAELEHIRCYLLDAEKAWSDTWADIDNKADIGGCGISTAFLPVSVTNPEDWKDQAKFLKADLFTMVFFASEIYSRRKDANAFFEHVFANMKPGAHVLYIDNNSPVFSDWMDGMAGAAGMEELDSYEGTKNSGFDEQMSDLSKYIKIFGSYPKIQSNIAVRVWRKAEK